MKRYGVRPSVRPSVVLTDGPTAANLQHRVCCCGPSAQEISIDCMQHRRVAGERGQCHVVRVRR